MAIGIGKLLQEAFEELSNSCTAIDSTYKEEIPTTHLDWTSECEEAFTKVEELVTLASILLPPDLSKPFFLSTDACERFWSCVRAGGR